MLNTLYVNNRSYSLWYNKVLKLSSYKRKEKKKKKKEDMIMWIVQTYKENKKKTRIDVTQKGQ